MRAALDCYVSAGTAVPSVRTIATAAGVSTGSVQHFFPAQLALRSAVNDYVVGLLDEVFGVTLTGESGVEVEARLDERLTSFYAEYPVECRYLARTLIDGGETATELFTALMRLSSAQWRQLDDDGVVRPDVDRVWAALQVVIVNIGTVLLAPLIGDYLGAPLSQPELLSRWRHAQTALFTGLYSTACQDWETGGHDRHRQVTRQP
jgi:AcrR family transcriptional regulator